MEDIFINIYFGTHLFIADYALFIPFTISRIGFIAKNSYLCRVIRYTKMSNKSIYNYEVGSEKVDFMLHATIESLCSDILNVAGVDANNKGISAAVLMQQNRSWVLSRMAVEIDRQPEQFERYDIHTWVNPHTSRLISTRNFELSDSEGKQFGRAVSQWCVIDFEKRMPVSLEEVEHLFEGKFCDEASPCEAPRKVRGVEPSVTRKHEVRYSDIDFNRHVNTMRYIRMMLNTLPIEYLTEPRPLRLDIHFAKECRLGEVLTIGYEQREDTSLFEIRNGEGLVACTAAIEWR